jgi:acyl-CoA synthetase (AMP-forming)/AMP-acid ligase II
MNGMTQKLERRSKHETIDRSTPMESNSACSIYIWHTRSLRGPTRKVLEVIQNKRDRSLSPHTRQLRTNMPHSFPLLKRIDQRARTAPAAPAIIDTTSNRTISYSTLYADICAYARELEALAGPSQDLKDARVGILAEKGYPIVVALLATFSAGGLAIPLLTSLPQPEHQYMLSNGTASVLLHDKKNEGRAKTLQGELPELTLRCIPDFTQDSAGRGEDIETMQELAGGRKAMMLFTSGTVSTYASMCRSC